jgi:hypothetical protein
MRTPWLMLSLAIALVLGRPDVSVAQRQQIPRDTNLTHVLYLADGTTLVGKLVSRDSVTINFETNGGMLTVPVARVKELREIRPADVKGDEYWFPDANETRLFFAPTGRMLKKGEGYYSNTYLLLQNFVGGVSDAFTLGGGFSIVPSDDFFNQNIYYVTPKVGLHNRPKTNIAVGALVGVYPGFSDWDSGAESFGILYGVATRGGPDASMTAGVGYGFHNGDFQSLPMLMLGGAVRSSRRVSLVTENYLTWTRQGSYTYCPSYSCPPTYSYKAEGVLSYGLRFMGEKLSTDFALWNATSEFIFPGIPYIAFAVKF